MTPPMCDADRQLSAPGAMKTPTVSPAQGLDAASLHTPVLLERCLELLSTGIDSSPAPAPVMIDCTLGMGGHTEGALRCFPTLRVIGIDRDPQAIELACRRLAPFGERFTAVQATYDHVGEIAARYSPYSDGTVDAILADLGVSSLQLDAAERGFSYARPAPLDMRMDPTSGMSAADLLNSADAEELTWILRTYGEERFAGKIAKEIVRRRGAGHPVTTTADLADLVRECIPAPARRTGGNPAKRTFQALRIAVNAELDVLERTIPAALNAVRVGGCVVIESYQSLEDRLVKQAFAAGTRISAPDGLPFIPDQHAPYLRALTHGAEQATEEETAANPRSAPVRLRAVERIRSAQQAPAPPPHARQAQRQQGGQRQKTQKKNNPNRHHRGRTQR